MHTIHSQMSRANAISKGDVVLRLVGTLFLLLSVMQLQASDNAIGALLYAGAAVLIFLTASLRHRYGA